MEEENSWKVNDIEKETSSVRHALSLILDLIVKYESYIRQNEDENFKIGMKEWINKIYIKFYSILSFKGGECKFSLNKKDQSNSSSLKI